MTQLSILISGLFSIVLSVFNLTDFVQLHVSSVRLGFTYMYRTPPHLIKAKKSPCSMLSYVNKCSLLLPKIYSLSLIPKTRPTSPWHFPLENHGYQCKRKVN